jgi:hypothetical protein
MRIFVFISSKDNEVLGFTNDQAGANLPPDYAPWEPATHGGAPLSADYPDDDARVVLEAVRIDGFCLTVGGYEDEGLSMSGGGGSPVHALWPLSAAHNRRVALSERPLNRLDGGSVSRGPDAKQARPDSEARLSTPREGARGRHHSRLM